MDASGSGTAKRQRLAERRKALGLTQEALAALLDVERSTVARWERGETKPMPWIRPRLVKALQVSAGRLEELLAGGAPSGSTPGSGSGRGDRAATAVPRQLPAAVADFIGRAAELAALTRVLDDVGAGTPGTVVISAIGGTAGVGKTALALHWAHQVRHRFADGQLHVNLRGFDPSGVPGTPAEAIRGFLDALGVPPERMPVSPDSQAALYRSLLADKRMLIVLDNARDERQVRPLLPASPASLVLVTSRNQLAGLAATDCARLLTLDVLTHAEAVELLTARIGTGPATAEPQAITEIATLCACLPLPLAVAAARAATRPGFPLATLATELRDTGGRLDALDTGDPAVSVRAVFSWSYQQLTDESARMFRLLGLHPGPDISVRAAASLAATTEPEACRLLDELAHAHLITEQVPGRYTLHDLLRAYAAVQARDIDSESDRAAAIGRLLDYYLHTAHAAALVLRPSREPVALTPPGPGAAPECPADYRQAMAWLGAEQHVLLAAVTAAAELGFDNHAWQIPWAMMPFLSMRGRYQECAATQRTALAAATRLGDLGGQAMSGRLLANVCSELGDYEQALAHAANSLELCQQLGNRLGEANAYRSLGLVAERQGRYADALGHFEEILRLVQAIGDKSGEADMFNAVGWCHGLLGDYEQARAFCRRSLTLAAELGNRVVSARALDSLGYAEHHLGHFDEAAACYQRGLSLFRELGDRLNEAEVLTHIGDTRHATGDVRRAREAWQQALAIFEDLSQTGADKIRAKLASLS